MIDVQGDKMRNVRIGVDRSGTMAGLRRTIDGLTRHDAIESLLLFSAGNAEYPLNEMNKLLKRQERPVMGGVVPSVQGPDGEIIDAGAVVVGLPVGFRGCRFVSEKDVESGDLERCLSDLCMGQGGTLLVLADAESARTQEILAKLFDNAGLGVNYVGGGTGTLAFDGRKSLYAGNRVVGGGLVVGYLPYRSGIGVAHGCVPVSEPLRVTSSGGRCIRYLDGRPASDVYEAIVHNHGRVARAEEFHRFASRYPIGICRISGEPTVRDPIDIDYASGTVTCVSEVPEGSYVQVLYTDYDDLIQAAETSKNDAVAKSFGTIMPELGIVFDCVSRSYALNRQNRSVPITLRERMPVVGIHSIGEIANDGGDFLEFLNKTVVTAVMGGPCDAQ